MSKKERKKGYEIFSIMLVHREYCLHFSFLQQAASDTLSTQFQQHHNDGLVVTTKQQAL
jgi:hypothetical protein